MKIEATPGINNTNSNPNELLGDVGAGKNRKAEVPSEDLAPTSKIELAPEEQLGSIDNEIETRQAISPRDRYVSSPQEVMLESGTIESEEKLWRGVMGDARFVKIRGGGEAVFKPYTLYEDEKRRVFVGRERAAYLMSKFLGFDFVPPTVVKMSNGIIEGSLQEFVKDAQSGSDVDSMDIDENERRKLVIFDRLICNPDRKKTSYFVKNGKIIAIDHDAALDPTNLADVRLRIQRIPPDVADRLKIFAQSEEHKSLLHDMLLELLGESTATLLMKRLTTFIECINTDNSFALLKFIDLMET